MHISAIRDDRNLLKTLFVRQFKSLRKMLNQSRLTPGKNDARRVRTQNTEQFIQKRQLQSKARTPGNRIGAARAGTCTKLGQIQLYRCRINRFSPKISLQFLLIYRYFGRSKNL